MNIFTITMRTVVKTTLNMILMLKMKLNMMMVLIAAMCSTITRAKLKFLINNDCKFIYNTQEELLTEEGSIQITMASHHNLQVPVTGYD